MAPNTWVRAFFSTFPKCDSLLNNNCEVFNKYILEARELPILSMLERIKSQLMTRFYNKQVEVAEKFSGPVCPKIRKKLLKNADYANVCYVLPAGHGIFQVQSKGGDYIVDVLKKKCDCRRWDLTGIPCNHAIALDMRGSQQRICSQLVIQLKLTVLCMDSLLCLAKTNPCGNKQMALRFSHLSMRKRLVGHQNLEGSSHMRFRQAKALNCQGME